MEIPRTHTQPDARMFKRLMDPRPSQDERDAAATRDRSNHSIAPLVLYTDGLIKRRHEDIDAGLSRLATSL